MRANSLVNVDTRFWGGTVVNEHGPQQKNHVFSDVLGPSWLFQGLGGSQRFRGRPAIHTPSWDIDFSSTNRFLEN